MQLKPAVLRFKFDDFESLPSGPDDATKSKLVKDYHGNAWRLHIYPGGESEKKYDQKMVAGYLYNKSDHDINAAYTFICRDIAGSVYKEHIHSTRGFKSRKSGWGVRNLIKRRDIFDHANKILVDGALIIDVEIQIISEPNGFRPENPFVVNMLKLFEDKEHADVTFKLRNNIVSAHKFVLRANAPMLFSLCDKLDVGSPMTIDNTTPEVFNIIMRYIYGRDAPEAKVIKKLGKEIIEAADRYGAVHLKMAVETSLVEQRVIGRDDVVDWLLFADAKTCPLLKDYALAYFSSRLRDMLNHKSSKELDSSPELMREIMFANSIDQANPFHDASKLSVDELRKKLNDQGMDVDGSKEVLASRLQESNKRQRTE